jgi:SanA protein
MRFFTLKSVARMSVIGAGFLVALIIAANLGVYFSTQTYIYDEIADAPLAQTVLIPGAAVMSGGELSPIFVDRINIAIKLYEAKKVSKILVSGDNSAVSYNEVNPVRLYLLSEGVPDQDIFLDHAGFDTYSSMYRARDVFGVTSVLVATQSFHLPRAIYIARKLGLEANGVNADVGRILNRNYVREIFANEKALLDLFLKRKPKYLGDPIPITGDGREY